MHSPKAPKPSIAQQQSASRANAPVQPFAGSPGSQLGGLLGDQSMWFSYMRPRSRPPLGSLATDPGATPKKPPGVWSAGHGWSPGNEGLPGVWQLEDGNLVNQRPGRDPLGPANFPGAPAGQTPKTGSFINNFKVGQTSNGYQLEDGNWVNQRPGNPLGPANFPGAPAGQTPKNGSQIEDNGINPLEDGNWVNQRPGNFLPPAIYPGAPAGQTPKNGKFKVGLW